MMRWLIGIGVAVVLLVAGLGTLAYFFLVRPAQNFVQEFGKALQLEAQLPSTPYTPPASGLVSSQQVERLASVQQAVVQGLGDTYTNLQQRFGQLADQVSGQATLDYRTVLDLFGQSTNLLVQAKELQVNAALQAGFSQQEYQWVRQQIYSALNLGIPQIDPQQVLEQIRQGNFETVVPLLQVPGLPLNKEQAAPYLEQFRNFYALTWFGL